MVVSKLKIKTIVRRLWKHSVVGEAIGPWVSYNDVIQEFDAHETAGINQALGEGVVFLAGCGISRWMIVHGDERGGVSQYGGFKDFSRVDKTAGEVTNGDGMKSRDVMFGVEQINTEFFPVQGSHVSSILADISTVPDEWLVGRFWFAHQ